MDPSLTLDFANLEGRPDELVHLEGGPDELVCLEADDLVHLEEGPDDLIRSKVGLDDLAHLDVLVGLVDARFDSVLYV